MAYKYETKNCEHCEHCVKTDKGLYCLHREGHPKVTNGGWCIDRKEKQGRGIIVDDTEQYE